MTLEQLNKKKEHLIILTIICALLCVLYAVGFHYVWETFGVGNAIEGLTTGETQDPYLGVVQFFSFFFLLIVILPVIWVPAGIIGGFLIVFVVVVIINWIVYLVQLSKYKREKESAVEDYKKSNENIDMSDYEGF